MKKSTIAAFIFLLIAWMGFCHMLYSEATTPAAIAEEQTLYHNLDEYYDLQVQRGNGVYPKESYSSCGAEGACFTPK